jgi:hypothetical protein
MENILVDIKEALSCKFNILSTDYEEMVVEALEFFYDKDETIYASIPESAHELINDKSVLVISPFVWNNQETGLGYLIERGENGEIKGQAIIIASEDGLLLRFTTL